MKLPPGSQQTIGEKDPEAKSFTFQMPQKDPVTDEDVTAAHELIAEIEKAMEPSKEDVEKAKAAIDAIDEGLRACFRQRLEEESTGERQVTIPMDGVARPDVGEVAAAAARKFANSVEKSNLDSVTVTAGGKSVTIRGRGRKGRSR